MLNAKIFRILDKNALITPTHSAYIGFTHLSRTYFTPPYFTMIREKGKGRLLLSSFAPQFPHLVVIASQTIFPPTGGHQHSWWSLNEQMAIVFRLTKMTLCKNGLVHVDNTEALTLKKWIYSLLDFIII